jgi:hypothetical protein
MVIFEQAYGRGGILWMGVCRAGVRRPHFECGGWDDSRTEMSSLRYQSPAAIKESGHFLRMLRNLPLSQASRIGRSYIASTLQGLVDAINPVAPFQRPQAHRRPRQDCPCRACRAGRSYIARTLRTTGPVVPTFCRHSVDAKLKTNF